MNAHFHCRRKILAEVAAFCRAADPEHLVTVRSVGYRFVV
jgi:hypothetical protein